MKDLKQLPKPELKVAAKTLILFGYSSRKVEQVLGIDNVTALRYADEPTPDELKQFETIFTAYIAENKKKGLALVHKRLLELIPEEEKIDQVVKAGEFYEGKNQQNLNVQVNQFSGIEFTNESEDQITSNTVSGSPRPAQVQNSVRRETLGKIDFEPADNA